VQLAPVSSVTSTLIFLFPCILHHGLQHRHSPHLSPRFSQRAISRFVLNQCIYYSGACILSRIWRRLPEGPAPYGPYIASPLDPVHRLNNNRIIIKTSAVAPPCPTSLPPYKRKRKRKIKVNRESNHGSLNSLFLRSPPVFLSLRLLYQPSSMFHLHLPALHLASPRSSSSVEPIPDCHYPGQSER
jgi:hypothetical protein